MQRLIFQNTWRLYVTAKILQQLYLLNEQRSRYLDRHRLFLQAICSSCHGSWLDCFRTECVFGRETSQLWFRVKHDSNSRAQKSNNTGIHEVMRFCRYGRCIIVFWRPVDARFGFVWHGCCVNARSRQGKSSFFVLRAHEQRSSARLHIYWHLMMS